MSSTSLELTSILVRAGAGAGKTTELTSRVLGYARRFKESQGRWPRVVVTTFTRKATQELRERLVQKTCEQEDWELLKYVSSPSQLHISTIHGVVSLFLRRYGKQAGMDPGFQIQSDAQAVKALRRLLKKQLLEFPESLELLEEYSAKELLQMLRTHYPFWMKSEGKIQALSKEQSEAALASALEGARHSCREILGFLSTRELPDGFIKFGFALKEILSLLERDSGEEALKKALELWPRKPAASGKNKIFDSSEHEHISQLLKAGKEILEKVLEEREAWPHLEHMQALYKNLSDRIFPVWKRYKYEMGQFQMEDLELFALDLARKSPESLELFSQDWDFWLVDEYQDTSPLQDELLDQLKGTQPCFYVGDPQQSIYLFRGARYENFEEKMRYIEQTGEVLIKDIHYRSCGELLEFFNAFFRSIDSRFLRMIPHREVKDPGRKVAYFHSFSKEDLAEDKDCELHALALRLQNLLSQGVPPQEIAILARKKDHLRRLFNFLKLRNFPVQLQSAGNARERRESLDAMSFLKFLINPHDNSNLVTLLRSPWWGIEDGNLMRAAQGKEKSLWLNILQSLSDLNAIQVLQEARQSLQEKSLSEVLEEAFIQSGLLDWSRRVDSSGRREANLWKWIWELKEMERSPGFNYLSWVGRLEREVDLEKDQQEGDAVSSLEPHRIQLLTIHAAKGLEYEHVLLPFCGSARSRKDQSPWIGQEELGVYSLKVKRGEEEKRRPCWVAEEYLKQQQMREQEESQRVLYVALTRAKESVSVFWSGKVETLSWASYFEDFLKEHSLAPSSYFSIEKGDGLVEETSFSASPRTGAVLRKPFDESASVFLAKKWTVSSLLNAESPGGVRPAVLPPATSFHKWERAAEGSLVHRVFETLKFRKDWNLEEVVQTSPALRKDELKKALEWSLALSFPPLASLIREGEVEWGFQFKTPMGLMEGQIDLWGEVSAGSYPGLWIVDYKTGRPEYEEQAFRQLWLYSQALRKWAPSDPVYLAVVYPFSQKVSVCKAPREEISWSSQGEIQKWPSLEKMSQ